MNSNPYHLPDTIWQALQHTDSAGIKRNTAEFNATVYTCIDGHVWVVRHDIVQEQWIEEQSWIAMGHMDMSLAVLDCEWCPECRSIFGAVKYIKLPDGLNKLAVYEVYCGKTKRRTK